MKLHELGPRFAAGLLMFISLGNVNGQGTFQWTVTFDGSPSIPPSDEFAIHYYSEQGMVFTGQFSRSGGQPALTSFPRNGTAYLFGMFGDSLAVNPLTGPRGARFGLVSVDLAEFSTLYQTPLTVQFIGYRRDGSMVTTELVTDGIIDGAGPLNDFQTFYFDSRFADLVRVEVPSYGWSLDNMVFSNVVPEPTSAALLLVGGLLVYALRRQRPTEQV